MTATVVADAVARAQAEAPFLRDALTRFPELAALLADDGVEQALKDASHRSAGDSWEARIRDERARLSLVVALADLTGLASFERTVETLTSFADNALNGAIRAAMFERTCDAEPRGFAAIALGKQGSRELNYSSDIDPIFLFDPLILPRRPREDAGQAAVRIARRVVELLQARTADGYVLRVDLRLRPSPEVFPIALPVDAAIAYYESSALAWERAAFIRARAAAGDIALGEAFLDAIRPFVWRRSLDYGAITEITGISRRIRDENPDAQAFGPGYDLKRGRGGIREIEFFAQVHQLIHGGRDASLRAPATLDALRALAGAGHIDADAATALADAYRLLRTIEHRLQMVDDRQTHSLPSGDGLDGVARLHGLADGEALLGLLAPHVRRVAALYDRLAGESADAATLPDEGRALGQVLRSLGFADPAVASRQITAWRQGSARSLRSPTARAAFEAMLPALVEAVGQVPEPLRALHRFDDIVQRVPSGINLYRLLGARPALVGLLAQILGHAPALADQLARNPALLDGLIDASALQPPPDVAALAAHLRGGVDEAADYERFLDGVRRRVNEWRFALGVQMITARADPLDVAAGYARVAQAAIEVLGSAAVARFARTHGDVPGCELVIVGLGRLGGEALTHASDLDMITLFTGGIDASSDGAKPLRATDYFNRLARRITAALSIPTAAGPLYDVDTRLRPSGVHGMLAVSVAANEAYARDDAWTFEHMALTRARTVFGSDEARAATDAAIRAVLGRGGNAARTIADAAAMRLDMERHKPPASFLDVKNGPGGLVDLEFAVHLRQLICGEGFDPRLGVAIAVLIERGLLPPELAEAHHLLGRMLVVLRLVAPGGGEPEPASRALVAQACGHGDWTSLLGAHSEARRVVADVWRSSQGGFEC